MLSHEKEKKMERKEHKQHTKKKLTKKRKLNVLAQCIIFVLLSIIFLGEYTKSIDLIKQNVQSFEFQYGSFSVEVCVHAVIAVFININRSQYL